ncbi:hypothetical protein JAMGFMIE_02247 [Rheinheimera sp. MM224]|nr:hypothetical protein JAMGFMIE_02247 [Rheinheimera sp. MM224]
MITTLINGQLTILDRNPNDYPKDFCLNCLCIFDDNGQCICTKYTKNEAGFYVRNTPVEQSVTNQGAKL